jgi:UDP-3-O-[3-hydroxymyristoyl] glucosamine N-acyltransferase
LKGSLKMNVPLLKIASLLDGNIIGDSGKLISGVTPFDSAGKDDITMAGSKKFLSRIDESKAGAIIVPLDFSVTSQNLIQVDNPKLAFAKVKQYFHPPAKPETGIHPQAQIGLNFKFGQSVAIGPFVYIGDRVTLGDRVWLQPGVFIGDDVTIGEDVTIYPNVSILRRCIIGNRVSINSCSVIGSDGFGYAQDGEVHHKIPHTGIVQIDDDVEIGANNTIDRGTFGKTWICQGVKTDNHVHVAHNVTVGQNTLLVAQVGISGSTTIGKNAILAGQAGIAEHLNIGDHAIVGPQTGVGKSVPDGQAVMSGFPEMPYNVWLRVQRTVLKLPDIKKKLGELEKRLQYLEEKK